MTQETTEYGEQFAYADIAEYESLVGYKMSDAFKLGWEMARMKNKHFGFLEPETKEEPETELP